MGFKDLVAWVDKIRRPEYEEQAKKEIEQQKITPPEIAEKIYTSPEVFSNPVQSTFKGLSLLLPGVAPYQATKGMITEFAKPAKERNFLLGATKGLLGQTSFNEFSEFNKIAGPITKFAIETYAPSIRNATSSISETAFSNLAELGVDIMGMAGMAKAPGAIKAGISKLPDLAKQRIIENIPAKTFRVTGEMIRDITRGAASSNIISEIESGTGITIKDIWNQIKTKPVGQKYVDIEIPGKEIVKWADRPWWSKIKQGFQAYKESPLGSEAGFAKFSNKVKQVPAVISKEGGGVIPENILQDIYKGKPIAQDIINKYPELQSGKYILNTEQDIIEASKIRPQVIETQKRLDSIVDKIVKTIPGVSKIKGSEITTSEIRAKSVTSTALKVNRRKTEEGRLDYKPTDIKDAARNSFIVSNPTTNIPSIIKNLGKGWSVDVKLTTPHASGFMGIFANQRDVNGIGQELQFFIGDDGWNLKLKTDGMYRKWRTLNTKTLTKSDIQEYNRLRNTTLKLYQDFYSKKGYADGSLSELESLINNSALESGMTVESKIAAMGRDPLTQVFLEGDQNNRVSLSTKTLVSVTENLKSFIPTSTKSISQGIEKSKDKALLRQINSIALTIPQVKGAGVIPVKTTSTEQEINSVVSKIDTAIKNNPSVFPTKEKPAITSNQDYGVSFDPENLCARGYSFTTALDGLRSKLYDMAPGIKTEAGRKLLELGQATGLEVPCNQCYVAEKRILGSSAKSSEVGLSEYKLGEITKESNKKFIQDAIVRMYSFGDFNPSHIPSVTKFLQDLQANELGCGTYTKNLNFLEIFGDTGIKFNISSGKTTAVGIPLEIIKPYLDRYPNASVVYVGINNADVLKIGGNPDIHHIIPAHIGPGTPKELLNRLSGLEWENFAKSQSEKIKIGNREYNLFGKATEVELSGNAKALEEARSVIKKAMYTGNGFKYLMSIKKASKILGQEITPKFPQFVQYDWYHKLIGSGQAEYGVSSTPVKINTSKINTQKAEEYFRKYPIIRDDKIAEYSKISNKIESAARSGGVDAIRALYPDKIDVSVKQFGLGFEGDEVGTLFRIKKPIIVKDVNTGESKTFTDDGKPIKIVKKVMDSKTKQYEYRIEDGNKAWVTLEDLEKFGEYESAPDKIRGFITTVKGAEKTVPEVSQIIDSRYIPGVNKEMVSKASLLVESNPSEAYRLANMEDPAVSELPYIQVVSTLILDKAQVAGNFAEAKRIVDLIAKRGTSSGQSSQVLAIYERLSPEGVLRYADSVIEEAKYLVSKEKLEQWEKLVVGLTSDVEKEALAKKIGIPYLSEDLMAKLYNRTINIKSIGVDIVKTEEIRRDIINQLKQSAGILKLSPKISDFVLGEAIKNLDDRRIKLIEIGLLLKDIVREVPVDMWDKVSFVQTLSMLLNPKTAIRNILGNAGFWAVENLSQTIGAGLDVSLSFITGKRTIYCPNLEAQWRGANEGWGEGLQEALLGIDVGNNVTTRFQLPKNSIFDGGVMGALEKTLGVELRAPDKAFYKATFNDTLQAEMKAVGVSEPTFEMIEYAHYMGLYRTFQDDSALATMLVTLKRAFNTKIFKSVEDKKWQVGKWGAGDMVLKFPKVPGNLASRGLEYSPFGFASTVFQLGRALLKKGFDQKTFVQDTSRAFTGSVLYVGAGALLASLGIISAKRLKDMEAQEMIESTGLGAYKINISALKRFVMSGFSPDTAELREGDTWVSYDWFQPHSVGIAMGANMADEKNANFVDAIIEASNTLVEQPVLQGVQQIQKGESIIRNLGNMAKGIPASFVPTLLNQVKQLTDNVSRETRDPNYFKEVYNKVIYKIPGLSRTLPERVNTWGEKKEVYQAGGNNPFNVFLNPAFVSKYNPSGEAKLVLDIWKQSGETIQFPRKAPKSIMVQGKKRDLTPDEQRMFQEYIGNKTGILYRILYNDPLFMRHSNDTKAKKLQGFLTDIYGAAKIKVLRIDAKPSNDVKNILLGISDWWKKDAYQRDRTQNITAKRGFLKFVSP